MNARKPEGEPPSRRPGFIWAALIALWAALVYALFTVNFFRDFLSSRGGW